MGFGQSDFLDDRAHFQPASPRTIALNLFPANCHQLFFSAIRACRNDDDRLAHWICRVAAAGIQTSGIHTRLSYCFWRKHGGIRRTVKRVGTANEATWGTAFALDSGKRRNIQLSHFQ